ncbi:DNA replication/repair protein RecF [Paenibacillus sp.]|uniref:DNA replication/repair protein RecF n=1 Tax=Paenibacillus sp. TaxID=58172 RepID=UPI002D3D863D|nr:DNA replication/repair protein RecF [Paenibacillus sp.]HZG57270.1 DNA replication/repair protein RecF [Paenibacillus sp.]
MKVTSLSLRNYRNYPEVDLSTDHRVNVFIGQNAQGKTNLLEAIYMLALTKSHRTSKDKELIRWGEDRATLAASAERKYGDCRLQLDVTNQGKKARINGLEQRKLSEYIGTLNVVLFAPEDLEIVKGSPGVRRRFLDMEIAQVHPSYLHSLSQYHKVLVQRNNFLKSGQAHKPANEALLSVWDEQLATYGSKIMLRRQGFITKLQAWAETVHRGIAGGGERLEVGYAPSLEMAGAEEETVLFDRFMIKLTQTKEQELRRGATLVGPHRDDLSFRINGKDAYSFGSQGQQRTAALSLKLAEIELIKEETGEYPVLLLDDVLSELDRHRQTQLIETFRSKVQTFITTTGVEGIRMESLDDVRLFRVNEGAVDDRPE